MWTRLIILAATAAISGGVALGRRTIDRQIEKQLPTAIETARAMAQAELDKQIKQVVAERLSRFVLSLLIKAGLVGGAYLLFDAGHLTGQGLKIVVGFLIIVFLFRDALSTLPYIAPAFSHIRQHQWNLQRALREFIAGVAFERAYAATMVMLESGNQRYLMAFSRHSPHSISTEVGEAVREVARTTSFEAAKWRFVVAVTLAAVMSAVYAMFVFFTIGAA